jgi:hypothetical protein
MAMSDKDRQALTDGIAALDRAITAKTGVQQDQGLSFSRSRKSVKP